MIPLGTGQVAFDIGRRQFISALGGAAAMWPLAVRAQQSAMPVVGVINAGSADAAVTRVAAFRKGLTETGFIEGQNVTIEYTWLEGHFDRLPAVMADLVRRQVAVIATVSGAQIVLAAKAATATIPIVFGVAEDPVRLGLVASLARPGGNATGINFLNAEVSAKRLELLHELVPTAARVALLVDPADASNTESNLTEVPSSARAIGLQIQVLRASTSREIDTVFVAFVRERPDALFVGNGAFFYDRRVQLAILAARHAIPMATGASAITEVGGLMSYGSDVLDAYRQVGVYTGQILKGAKPADLPVVQASKFELVINLQTAKTLGIEIPPNLLARADEVIE